MDTDRFIPSLSLGEIDYMTFFGLGKIDFPDKTNKKVPGELKQVKLYKG